MNNLTSNKKIKGIIYCIICIVLSLFLIIVISQREEIIYCKNCNIRMKPHRIYYFNGRSTLFYTDYYYCPECKCKISLNKINKIDNK